MGLGATRARSQTPSLLPPAVPVILAGRPYHGAGTSSPVARLRTLSATASSLMWAGAPPGHGTQGLHRHGLSAAGAVFTHEVQLLSSLLVSWS